MEEGPALSETLKSSTTAVRSASTRLLVCRTRCRLLSLMRNVKVCVLCLFVPLSHKALRAIKINAMPCGFYPRQIPTNKCASHIKSQCRKGNSPTTRGSGPSDRGHQPLRLRKVLSLISQYRGRCLIAADAAPLEADVSPRQMLHHKTFFLVSGLWVKTSSGLYASSFEQSCFCIQIPYLHSTHASNFNFRISTRTFI